MFWRGALVLGIQAPPDVIYRRKENAAPISEMYLMRVLCWHGKGDVRVDTVPDPKIEHPRDAVVEITACAICGSDLHHLDGSAYDGKR